MRTSFLDYAMSVIVSRALPDVRDGLKPVHRRILYAMHDLRNAILINHIKNQPVLSAKLLVNIIHMVTQLYMKQWFGWHKILTIVICLVDGHGNFGSIDGDSAAAMRYTEARMSKISMELLRDINKDTIDYQDNYDGEEREPVVFPARFPNLLVNGTSGIAVGMATNIPPHHLGEVIDGVLALSHDPEITIQELMEYYSRS